MIAKMKHDTPLGSRIAEIHNGSSLFTGDAGQGESNIRRWIIENDWLEAIIALPNNMFYNTGIATYIWVLSNRKEERRRGKVQLIDATKRFTPRRKNLGAKNADLSDVDQQAILDEFLVFEESETSKIFDNDAFGYWKVAVERPLRLRVEIPAENPGLSDDLWSAVQATNGDTSWPRDYEPGFFEAFKHHAKQRGLRITAAHRKQLRSMLCIRDENAQAVIANSTRLQYVAGSEADPLHGQFLTDIAGKPFLVEYEPDPELRDTEQVPLSEPGGIAGFIEREVLPHVPDAWVTPGSEKLGYEISFTRYFYKPKQLRALAEIEADIRALERETDGLLADILLGVET
jgi:type I restriction enzyme M protein